MAYLSWERRGRQHRRWHTVSQWQVAFGHSRRTWATPSHPKVAKTNAGYEEPLPVLMT